MANASALTGLGPRRLAADILDRVHHEGGFSDALLMHGLASHPDWPQADRALATQLVYGVLTERGHLDRRIRKLSGTRLKDLPRKVRDPLRLGVYQIVHLDRIPNHAAVNTSVDVAKQRGGSKAANTVNAILRKAAAYDWSRYTQAIPNPKKEPGLFLSVNHGVNVAVAEALIEALGFDLAQNVLAACQVPAPTTLRINPCRVSDAPALMQTLDAVPGQLEESLVLPHLVGLAQRLPAVEDGLATVQDEASMAVTHLLDPQPGERILDYCAAPGGKTTHIAERMGDAGEVWAHDRHPRRLESVNVHAERLGLTSIGTHLSIPPSEVDRFDRLLVDAPCSGLGTLRRHPEIRYRYQRERDAAHFAELQTKILSEATRYLKPGGTLVYSLCTLTKDEGPDRIRAVLPTWQRLEEIRRLPSDTGSPDGFYAVKLKKP